MQLTSYSDYSLRVLLYLALNSEATPTIKDIAANYDISKNHLMKVVNNLTQTGYVEAIRGRSGGLRLARDPSDIVLGEVIRKTEGDFRIVECFDAKTNTCVIARDCRLKHILNEALSAFLDILDRYTLQDLALPQASLKEALNLTD
jgi:Rrf2 family nitric oxide-sensitive transcriptional repressor